MRWMEFVIDHMKKAPEEEYSAPEIVDTLFPDLSSYNRTMAINKVNHALNQGRKFGFFVKLDMRENRRYWRLVQ